MGEERKEELEEVLSVTQQDIRNMAPYVRDILDNSKLVVVGNEKIIRNNTSLFENIEFMKYMRLSKTYLFIFIKFCYKCEQI